MSNFILVGFKSSGKTTLGKKIAEQFHLHFIDTDALVAKNNREFYLQGVDAFREREKEVIGALQDFQKCVIATGGGAILDPENVTLLKKMGTIIYLRVPKETLKQRLLTVDPLPAILDPASPEESFELMYLHRASLYEQASDYAIENEYQLIKLIDKLIC
ncbi:MAG TPA: shikimate kinase [Candidatus Babeliaceae bacterium]|nr:shikimate kinase [Candidatus Babeliaceae bacterium]